MNNKRLNEIVTKLKEENAKESWEKALEFANERIKKADTIS